MPSKLDGKPRQSTRNMTKNSRKRGVVGAKARNNNPGAERHSETAIKAASARWQKGEKEMTEFCSAGLHDLLSEGGRELHNVKFLAGTEPTEVGMCDEAQRVVASAIGRGMPHNPPKTGKKKTKL